MQYILTVRFIISFLIVRFLILYIYERYINKRAPIIGLIIPWLGAVPFYLFAPLMFLDYCKYVAGGNAFTIYLAGRYINVRLGDDFERYFYHAPESQLSFIAAAQDFFGPTLGREAFAPDEIKSFSKLRHTLLGNPSRHIHHIYSLVNNFLDNLMVKLRKKGNIAGKEEYKFNMIDYIPNFISKINISCLVGMELGENENFITDFTKIEHGINMTSSLPPFLSWFLLIQAKNAFKRFQGNIIKAIHLRNRNKNNNTSDDDDLLNLIQNIHSLDEETIISARVFSVLYAGGTTSKLIAQVIILILNRPNVLAMIQEEIFGLEKNSNCGKKLDLLKLVKDTPYFSSCIEEALRLKTGILSIRKAMSVIKRDNFNIYKNELVAISPYYSHHQTKYFKNPTLFNPSINHGNNNKKKPNHGWGGGNHMCAGRLFAIYVAKIVIATFLQRLDGIQLNAEKKVKNADDDFTVPGIALCKPCLKFKSLRPLI
eukprot:g7701.t1